MRPADVDRVVMSLVSLFFSRATVSWANTKQTINRFPHVSVRGGTLKRTTHPIKKNIDGIPCNAFPSNKLYEIQLYTSGKPYKPSGQQNINMIVERENTATNDLTEFLDFMDSPAAYSIIQRKDVAISVYSDVQDLSEYRDGVAVCYRAVVELSVDFTQHSAGAYGMRTHPVSEKEPYEPNFSGGGTVEMAAEDTGYFTEVEFEQTDFDKEES